MKGKSAKVPKFQYHSTNGNLYIAIHYLNGTSDSLLSEPLHQMVAERIRKNERLRNELSTKRNNVDRVRGQIGKDQVPIWEIEVEALALIIKLVIHVLREGKSDQNKTKICMKSYGDKEPTYEECIYIYYDEQRKTFHPLHMIKKENPAEEQTLFPRNDEEVEDLIVRFVHEELHDVTFIHPGSEFAFESAELSSNLKDITASDDPFNFIAPDACGIGPIKRKLPGHANLALASTEQEVASPRKKRGVPENAKAQSDEDVSQPITIEKHLQTEFIMETDVQMLMPVPMVLNNEVSPWKIQFTTQPSRGFRGRTKGDFKKQKQGKQKNDLKKKQKHGNGKKARLNLPSPRWFHDQDNNPFIILSILKEYLLPNTEHAIEIRIVTAELDGYTYLHPYFKIVLDLKDLDNRTNPFILPFSADQLTAGLEEGVKQLKIRIMLVMDKDSDLLQTAQPLPVFSRSEGGNEIIATFSTQRAFKEAYDLRTLRFVATLMTRQVGGIDYERHDDIQCISQISKEDKNYKHNNTKISRFQHRPSRKSKTSVLSG